MNKIQSQDKRRDLRLRAYHLVKYKVISDAAQKDAPMLMAAIVDIGAGGVRLSCDEPIAPASIIEIKINFPSWGIPIFSLAKVVWIRKRGKSNRFLAGLQFLEVNQAMRNLISEEVNLVNNKLKLKKYRFLFTKGDGTMKNFSKILIILAVICVLVALSLKVTTMGKLLPGPLPINWAKLADTFLLFAIAVSLLNKDVR
ncbi:MAG: PilZ domain-containing protein [Candidatus Omnitrophota bacterium]|jgi:hypothetical protein|nr:MAG: PilZ domain-containing protein [Candidatus Omnitrophota bacterium]